MIFPENTDELLLGRMRSSDEDAFTELYQRYWRPLYSSALRRMSEDDARDIIQELFVSLWGRREHLPDDVKVAEYLYTALRYRVINYLQASQVRLKYANSVLTEQDPASAATADGHLAVDELKNFIQEAVDKMPLHLQEVFLLSYKKGLSPKEIATQLSLSVQTVKNYLTNARAFLKSMMREHDAGLYAYVMVVCLYPPAS